MKSDFKNYQKCIVAARYKLVDLWRPMVLILLLSVTSLVKSSAQAWSPVKTKNGLVQGTAENGVQIFKGIPFAAPPVGENRWRAPQPASNWQGILKADAYATAPFQGGNPPSGKSEDCLYLNIWSPAKNPGEKLPVLVWIYGGGFAFGSTSEPGYNGINLAQKGVVLVSVAYRVGQLGFLAHPELTAESGYKASGNYGILDMITGLQWIKENISAFGGDPGKVTIFGESAGGIAVSMLAASPLAKGLIHGAISQSGGNFGPPRPTTYPGENLKTLKQAEEQGVEYMKKAGVNSIAELRAIPAEQLPMGFGMPGGWPIIDGYVQENDQYTLYTNKKFNDIPVLIGYNSDEGMSFRPPKTPEEYITSTKERYGKFADALIKAYPVGEKDVPKTARDLARDAAFGWQTYAWAELQSQKGKAPVYYYYFDQHPVYDKSSPQYGTGSPHGQDVAYVFGFVNPKSQQADPSDPQVSEAMMTYWTNFAKTGDPNGPGVSEWLPYTAKNHRAMHFRQGTVMGEIPSESSMKVLTDYFSWRRTKEGMDWAK